MHVCLTIKEIMENYNMKVYFGSIKHLSSFKEFEIQFCNIQEHYVHAYVCAITYKKTIAELNFVHQILPRNEMGAAKCYLVQSDLSKPKDHPL